MVAALDEPCTNRRKQGGGRMQNKLASFYMSHTFIQTQICQSYNAVNRNKERVVYYIYNYKVCNNIGIIYIYNL